MLGLCRVSNKDERREGGGGGGEEEETTCEFTINPEEFPEFADHRNLLESFDFDDLFGDSLPELAADFSDHISTTVTTTDGEKGIHHHAKGSEEVVSKRDDDTTAPCRKRKYSSASSCKTHKPKVDWTPELHRRFVQAVEQLGVDKAVPSRILDLMNIHSLTRHNVASHLQKYRSHRKHLRAREAEAANWTRKRQIYGADASRGGCGGIPTIGFPPQPQPQPQQLTYFRPLHVWGHPTMVDHHVWPKHIPTPSPTVAHPPFWPPLPPPDPPYWQRIFSNGTTPGTPCFPGFGGTTPVTGIPQPPHGTVYKSDRGFGPVAAQSAPRPPLHLHPSKESVDAAIGDVLTKPWLPLPLGLKPPSVDSVMANLHRHGVSHVPPTASSL